MGLFHKPTLYGADLTWQKLFRIHAGDLVFSNIKAWEGAFAVASFQWFYLLTPEGMEQVLAASPGSADRNRTLGLKRLEKVEVPVPSYDKQLRFERLLRQVRQIHAEHQRARKELNVVVPSLINQLIGSHA